MQSEQINEIATALAKAQGEFKPIKKDSQSHRHKYADLPTILDAVRPAMAKFGLSLTFLITSDETLCGLLLHASGQWIKTHTPLKPKSDIHQDFGAAITYKRRYLTTSILGIAPYDETDDDGVRDANRAPAPDHPEPCRRTLTVISLDKAQTLNDKFMGYPTQLKQFVLDSFKIKDFSELTDTDYTTAINRIKKALTSFKQ